MAFSFKKTAAAAVAIICAASMCGCADDGSLMSIDGINIPNGLYLSNVITAHGNAHSEISSVNAEAGDTSEIEDIFAESIDGMTASEWIKAEALKSVKRYAAVERLFEEYGLSLPEGETESINADLNTAWDEESFYAQYIYGTNTMGEYYESVGIGKESMRLIYTTQSKENELFKYYFGTDGVNAVPDEELDAYLVENYAVVKYMQLEYVDKFGISLKEDNAIQAIKDTASSYVDRLNGGESYADVRYDYDLKAAQNQASADAEDAYAKLEDEVLPDFDAYIQEAVDAATAEKYENVDDLDVVINKASSTLAEDLTDFIWNSATPDGKAYLFETDTASYVIVREDITVKDNWIDENLISILGTMKGDEFEALLEAAYADYVVEIDDYLVNNKYAPENIKGLE